MSPSSPLAAPSFRMVALAACCVFALSACKTSDIAKGSGAVLGAVIGSQIGGGSGRLVGAAIGAGLGYLAGSAIGELLEVEEQQQVNETSADALDNVEDGGTVTWSNPNNEKTAAVTVKETRMVERETVVLRRKDVMPAPSRLVILNKPYVAVKNSNVRKGPGTDFDRSGFLVAGDEIDVVGRVDGADWLMVARDGVSVGYVYEPLLRPASTASDATGEVASIDAGNAEDEDVFLEDADDAAPRLARATKTKKTSTVREPYDLDTLDLEEDLAVDKVAVETECRDLEIAVDADGAQAEEAGTACKAPDGAWEIVDLGLDDETTS